MHYHFTAQLRARAQANLDCFDCKPLVDDNLRKAAVALVVVPAENGPQSCILLTVRASRLNRHAGQYAFPGGKLDAGETPCTAALRELHEELRLECAPGDILGLLDDYPTRSGFAITPVVVWGGEIDEITPDPGEVDKVYRIPLRELDSPDIPLLEPGEPGGPAVLSAPLASLGHQVYAPTAAVMYQFREVVMNGRPTRVAHFDQPAFAWK